MKKFRAQTIASWLANTYFPYSVADIGGGKGLLSHLLIQNGWQSTTIDPKKQSLPNKYTGLDKKKVKIPGDVTVPRVTAKFNKDLVGPYDLLLGLHAHGVNMAVIKAAAERDKDFLLLPCCVIDEPIEKKENVNWRESLFEYAKSLGLPVKKVQFRFKGKNIAIYTDRFLKKRENISEEIIKDLTISPIDYSDLGEEH